MLIIDLLKSVGWTEIKNELKSLRLRHKDNVELYKKPFDEIISITPDIVTENKISITDSLILEVDYHVIHYLQEREESLLNIFTPWDTILGLDISDEDISKYGKGKLAAFVLDLMTFSGMTREDVDDVICVFIKNDIERTLSNIESM